MSTKKKRTKKHNKLKRYAMAARIATKHLAFASVFGHEDDSAIVYDMREGKRVDVLRHELVKALSEGQFKWHVLLAVFYRDQMGNEYTDFQEVVSHSPCWYEQVHNKLSEAIVDMTEKGNSLHFLTLGTICSPHPIDFDYAKADKIFSEIGAYTEFITEWERDTQQKTA